MWFTRIPYDKHWFDSGFEDKQLDIEDMQPDIKDELLRRAQDYDRRGLSTDSLYVREQLREIHIIYSSVPSLGMAFLDEDDVYSLIEHSMDIVKHHISRQNYFQPELILEKTVLFEASHPRGSVVADLVGLYRQQVESLAALGLNTNDASWVMLFRSAHFDNDELAESLFESGSLDDFSMDNALTIAAQCDAINLAKRSLAQGAKIQGADGKLSPLLRAVMHQSHKVVNYLLANGADINAGNSFWFGRPLICAAREASLDLLAVLLAHNPDIEAPSLSDGVTALLAAAIRSNNAAAVRLLLDKGANIEARDDFRQTALIKAACDPNRTDTMMLLLDKEANIEARDEFRQTA